MNKKINLDQGTELPEKFILTEEFKKLYDKIENTNSNLVGGTVGRQLLACAKGRNTSHGPSKRIGASDTFTSLASVRGGLAFWSSCWIRIGILPSDLDSAFDKSTFTNKILHDVSSSLV